MTPAEQGQPSGILIFVIAFIAIALITLLIKLPTLLRAGTQSRARREPAQPRNASPALPLQSEPLNVPQSQLQIVSIHDLATALNVAIIGPKGSGKTTTMTALLALRPGYIEALDPHSEPNKWPCAVVGGGLDYAAVHEHLLGSYETMRARYQASSRGERSQESYRASSWRFALAGDEWGSVTKEIPDQRATKERAAVMGAGTLLAKLLAQGRKVGIGVIVAAHDDTAAQLGLDGEMGLVACFDWLVYLSAAATGDTGIPPEVRQAARRMTRPAVALDTERHEWYLVTLDNAQSVKRANNIPMPADYARQFEQKSLRAAETPAQLLLSKPETELQPSLQEFQASQRGVAESETVAQAIVSPIEIALITMKLQQGIVAGAIAKSLPGYNARNYQSYKAKIDFVKSLLEEIATQEKIEGEIQRSSVVAA